MRKLVTPKTQPNRRASYGFAPFRFKAFIHPPLCSCRYFSGYSGGLTDVVYTEVPFVGLHRTDSPSWCAARTNQCSTRIPSACRGAQTSGLLLPSALTNTCLFLQLRPTTSMSLKTDYLIVTACFCCFCCGFQVLPALLTGILGYATATFIGIGLGQGMLRALAG